MSFTPIFSYETLDQNSRQLRLVRFACPTSSFAADIGLIIAPASLDDNPTYHALSYLWGDPLPTACISLNGRPFPINQNLHEALLQLRQNGVEAWFWVDAICIDQTSSEEKGWQVAQMGSIFSQAELVYFWLGPSSDDSDLVLEMAQRIGPSAYEAGIAHLWDGFYSKMECTTMPSGNAKDDKAFSFLARLLHDEDLRSPRLLEAIEPLLSRANWYRSWIIQEIILAQRGLVLFGPRNVDLDVFDAAVSAVYFCKISRFASQQPQWHDFGRGLNNNYFHHRGLLGRRQHQRGEAMSLIEYLVADLRAAPGRPFYAASDPRDIIFGFLGVAAGTHVLGLRTDYSQTVAEVYTAATRAMVKQCTAYRLEFCTFPKDTTDLPSWVPDWQRIGLKGVVLPISFGDHFKSSGDRLQPPVSGHNDPSARTLRLRGCLVDTVTAVLSIAVHYTCSSTLFTASASELGTILSLALITQFATPYLKTRASEIALWQTLAGGLMANSRCGPEYDTLAQQTFREEPVLAASLTDAELAYIFRNAAHSLLDPKDIVDVQNRVDDFCRQILVNAAARRRGRVLFVTETGAFGLGPENMRREDIVTILFGTQVPIILRPCGNHFTYLGDAYVHGIMDGEFMEGSPHEQDFDII